MEWHMIERMGEYVVVSMMKMYCWRWWRRAWRRKTNEPFVFLYFERNARIQRGVCKIESSSHVKSNITFQNNN